MHLRSKAYSIITLFVAAFTALFISCSQNTPELDSKDYSVVFDYTSEETPPSARLSIFASSSSDVRRYQRIKIVSVETGYIWDTQFLSKLEADGMQWAGCTNLVAPEGEKLPSGSYDITYYNADEKEFSISIDVNYDTELYEVLLPALPEFMYKRQGIENLAVYDKEHSLIYFGERSELRTTRDIWNSYREAETYQVIWYTPKGNVICVTPEKPVAPEITE